MKRVLACLLVSSLLYGSGAFWVALQAGAWAKMAAKGETSPCGVCLVVDKGMAAPQKAGVSTPAVHFAFQRPILSLLARLPVSAVHAAPALFAGRAVPPAEPPPDRATPAV